MLNHENAPSCNVKTVIDSETIKLRFVIILAEKVQTLPMLFD